MDTNHGIFFESTESFEASQALMQIAREAREDYRSTDRRVGWLIVGLCAVIGACCVGAYLGSQLPYDVPGVEVTR